MYVKQGSPLATAILPGVLRELWRAGSSVIWEQRLLMASTGCPSISLSSCCSLLCEGVVDCRLRWFKFVIGAYRDWAAMRTPLDRKSTRLNSSHTVISYA